MVLPRYPSAPECSSYTFFEVEKNTSLGELVPWNEQEEKMNSFSRIANTHDACVYISIYNYI